MARLGLAENDPVTVRSATGHMDVLARAGDLPPGNAAMYYPEANTLVPALFDSESKTPAFKSIAIRVSRASRLPVLS
jgi:anaerobic selenocysteine-containing dehydrogenase